MLDIDQGDVELSDRCLRKIETHHHIDPELAIQFFVKFSGIAKKTPRDRILRAVAEELLELCSGALAAAESLTQPLGSAAHDAVLALRRALCRGEGWDAVSGTPVPEGIAFPRAALEGALGRALGESADDAVVSWLRTHIDKHVALER